MYNTIPIDNLHDLLHKIKIMNPNYEIVIDLTIEELLKSLKSHLQECIQKDEYLVNQFIQKIKEKYDIEINCEYEEFECEYCISHTREDLEYDNEEFCCYVGGLIKELWKDNNFYRFSFSYNYYKDPKYKDLELEF